MDGPRDSHTEWSKSKEDKYNDTTYMWDLKKASNKLIYKSKIDLKM